MGAPAPDAAIFVQADRPGDVFALLAITNSQLDIMSLIGKTGNWSYRRGTRARPARAANLSTLGVGRRSSAPHYEGAEPRDQSPPPITRYVPSRAGLTRAPGRCLAIAAVLSHRGVHNTKTSQ